MSQSLPEIADSLGLIERLTGEPRGRVAELAASFGGPARMLCAEPSRLRREGLGEQSIEALGIARAAALCLLEGKLDERPILSSWDALLDYLRAAMAWEPVEVVRVLYLDCRNRLLANEQHSRGTVNEASVHIREVIRRALDLGACALIMVHNHPSGDPEPSHQDISLTNNLIAAGKPLGIAVHDHVVVGANGHHSMRGKGLIH